MKIQLVDYEEGLKRCAEYHCTLWGADKVYGIPEGTWRKMSKKPIEAIYADDIYYQAKDDESFSVPEWLVKKVIRDDGDNYSHIMNMTLDELAEFLNDWNWEEATESFGEQFCKKCKPIVEDRVEYSPCELNGEECIVAQEKISAHSFVKWWLKQPYREEKDGK